ncbi:MAG: hypothetical protein ACYC7D_14445 [Nitrososphaerales archaeon]
MQKQIGRKQESKQLDDVYGFEHKFQSASSLLDRSTKISEKDKEIIWRFIDLLKALRVSKGKLAKYIFHLKVIGANHDIYFAAATDNQLEAWAFEESRLESQSPFSGNTSSIFQFHKLPTVIAQI